MVTAEMHDLVKALIVKLRYTSDEAECVQMPTEVSFGDSVGAAHLSSVSRLYAMSLAEEAYVMDFCKRLDRAQVAPVDLYRNLRGGWHREFAACESAGPNATEVRRRSMTEYLER